MRQFPAPVSQPHPYVERAGLGWCQVCAEGPRSDLHAVPGTYKTLRGWEPIEDVELPEGDVRLVQVTDKLWVNPERVLSVEERTIDNGKGSRTFVELTLETMTRWRLDLSLEDVMTKLKTYR